MKPQQYTVSELAEAAGVSVRTLYLYDEIGLLLPAHRTAGGRRLYGEAEALRLQQILLYKMLGFSLTDIRGILDRADFDLLEALEGQKTAFQQQKDRIDTLLDTIDQTIIQLKQQGIMSKPDYLYKGIPKETADAWRQEAVEKWGDAATHAEQQLTKLSKAAIDQLKLEAATIGAKLYELRHLDPTDPQVQSLIPQHYANIRAFWGTSGSKDLQAEAYAGLGELFVADDRYLSQNGQPQPEFARFMCDAMACFAQTALRG